MVRIYYNTQKIISLIMFSLFFPQLEIALAMGGADDMLQSRIAPLKVRIGSGEELTALSSRQPGQPIEIVCGDDPSSSSPSPSVSPGVLSALEEAAEDIVAFRLHTADLTFLKSIESLFGRTKNLEIFSTYAYGISYMEDACYALLASYFKGWTKLRAVDFTGSRFGNHAADLVLPELCGHPSLEVIATPGDDYRSNAALSYKSRGYFLELAQTCPMLMVFNLAGTDFSLGIHHELHDGVAHCYFHPENPRFLGKSDNDHEKIFTIEGVDVEETLHSTFFSKRLGERCRPEGLYHGLIFFTPKGHKDQLEHLRASLPILQGLGLSAQTEQEIALLEEKDRNLPSTGPQINVRISQLISLW